MSKRNTLVASALLSLTPAAAFAAAPSQKLERDYQKAYSQAKQSGAQPGRNILRDGIKLNGR